MGSKYHFWNRNWRLSPLDLPIKPVTIFLSFEPHIQQQNKPKLVKISVFENFDFWLTMYTIKNIENSKYYVILFDFIVVEKDF